MDDASIIELFVQRSEQAINETHEKYGSLLYKTAYNILCRKADSDECVNDTYYKLWNSIPPDMPDCFPAYICTITKRLALSKFRYMNAGKRCERDIVPLDELCSMLSNDENAEDMFDAKEMSRKVSEFLYAQDKRDRIIFVRRYWFLDDIQDIAEMMKMNPRTVSTVLFRMRKKLKKYLMKEGFNL